MTQEAVHLHHTRLHSNINWLLLLIPSLIFVALLAYYLTSLRDPQMFDVPNQTEEIPSQNLY